jgi:hypothetical protein
MNSVRFATSNTEERYSVTSMPKFDEPKVSFLLSDAARMVTGSVIDFDQTVHGPYGDHVPTADALHA